MYFTFYRGLPQHAVERDGRLIISNAVPSDSGEYTCTAVDLPDVRPASARLTVEHTCESRLFVLGLTEFR